MKDLKEKVKDIFSVPEITEEQKQDEIGHELNKKIEELGEEANKKIEGFFEKLSETNPMLAATLQIVIGIGAVYIGWQVIKLAMTVIGL